MGWLLIEVPPVPPITLEQFEWSMNWAPWNVYGPQALNVVLTPQEIIRYAVDNYGAKPKITVH